MAVHKVGFLSLLLLFGIFLLLNGVEYADAKACTRNCDPRIRYGRCPKSGNKKFNVGCTNCCAARKGCNYFSADGTFVCEGETETKVETIETKVETMVESNKVCPFNCDGRISYSVCGNKRSSGRICTNCCAARKGCNYFSADGTFVCKGESGVDSMIEAVKPCPRNCDGRISYSICGDKRSGGRICTNCCAGKKGCNYFSADGTFVCAGESGVECI